MAFSLSIPRVYLPLDSEAMTAWQRQRRRNASIHSTPSNKVPHPMRARCALRPPRYARSARARRNAHVPGVRHLTVRGRRRARGRVAAGRRNSVRAGKRAVTRLWKPRFRASEG